MKMKMKGKPEFYPKVILLGTILPFLDMVAPQDPCSVGKTDLI